MKALSIFFLAWILAFTFPGTVDAQQLVPCLEVNGQKVIEGGTGIFSQVKTLSKTWSTLSMDSSPEVEPGRHSVRVKGIRYGDAGLKIDETWTFTITDEDITLHI